MFRSIINTLVIFFSFSFVFAQNDLQATYLKQAETFASEVNEIAKNPVSLWDQDLLFFTGEF